MKNTTIKICMYGILGALIFILKIIMSPLPNIEPVSLLLIVYTIIFGKDVICSLCVYIFLEIAVYGFGLWSVGYCYIWIMLVIVAALIYNGSHSKNALLWSLVSGLFGLITGALYIPLYIISGGPAIAISWWLSGITFDVIHGIANFILCLILFKPLIALFTTLNKQYKIND